MFLRLLIARFQGSAGLVYVQSAVCTVIARAWHLVARISCKFVPEKLSFDRPTVTLGTRVFSFSCATFNQVTQYVTVRDFKEKTSKARYSG